MAAILIENLFRKRIHPADLSKTLLQHFQDNGVDWMHACGGKGRCTTCKVIVTTGEGSISDLSAAELRYRHQGALVSNERLSCQVTISGDISVLVPREYQLPHVKYSDDR